MLTKLWNADFSNYKIPNLSILWVIVALSSVFIEFDSSLLLNFNNLFEKGFSGTLSTETLSYVLLGITLTYGCWLVVFILIHERMSHKNFGKHKLNSITLPHFLVNILDLVVTFGLVILLEKILSLFFDIRLNFASLATTDGEFHPFQAIIDFYNTTIPTHVELPYLIALFVILVCADLPIYVSHYLVHKSRFLWLVCHRSHHSPVYLMPFGSGPVFAFRLLIAVPYFFAVLAASKLIYPEPMIVELLVIQLIYAMTEKFNHTSEFYGFASKHRWFFAFFGNGPYHYTHHSAREGEEIVNIANIGFNFWDRLFGTFKKPEKEKPPIGLTHQPTVMLNPFRLYLGGLATILFELKHNHPKCWFRIIFGDVFYTPPITKEYLIVSYPEERL